MPAENLTLKAVWQARKTPRTLTLLYIIDGEPEIYPIEQTTLFENDFIVLPDLSAMPHLADPHTLRAWTRAAARTRPWTLSCPSSCRMGLSRCSRT